MVPFQKFSRWFNRDFWKAFRDGNFPIYVPTQKKEKDSLIESVYNEIKTSRYAPSLPENEIFMNKGHGVTRIVPVFSIKDYCVYYFCIKELEDVLCGNRTQNTFGGWTLGGKIRKKEREEIDIECEDTNYGRFSFNPLAWAKAFGEFNSILFSQLDQKNYLHILQFDIANFYDTIRLDILERWIREDSPSDKGVIVSLLFYFLNHWNRHNTFLEHQTVGLPQDALSDCSRILANYYLQKYDAYASEICNNANSLYLRYADDQMILTNSPSNLESTMLLLSKNLDHYGLRINQKKVSLWTNDELQRYRCRHLHTIFAESEHRQDPYRVRLFVDGYLMLTATQINDSWNGGMPLLNRLLWSNLESLPTNLFEQMMARFLSEKYMIQADYKKLGRLQTLNKKLKKPINFTEQLEKIGQKTVHNSFHFEALHFCQVHSHASSETYFRDRIKSLEEQISLGSSVN